MIIGDGSKDEIDVFLMSFEIVISLRPANLQNMILDIVLRLPIPCGMSFCETRQLRFEVMSAIKSLVPNRPSSILNPGHFRHQKILELNRSSKNRPNIHFHWHKHIMMIMNHPNLRLFRLFPPHFFHQKPGFSDFSTDFPWIFRSFVAGGDLHDRLSAAAATLSRLQQLALEALPFLYAENGLGRVWSETFGALAIYGKPTDLKIYGGW